MRNIIMAIIITIVFHITDNIKDKRTLTETNNRVISNEKITDSHHLITIKLTKPITFNAGQYVNLFIDREKRPYTPIYYKDDIIKFFIKAYGKGTFSNNLTKLYIRDKVIYVKGAFGSTYYNHMNDKLICSTKEFDRINVVMFPCGTGITRFYSILSNISKTKYDFKLHASFRNRHDAYLARSIEQYTTLYISDDGNRLNENKARAIIYSNLQSMVLICGTVSYSDMIARICQSLKVAYVII